VTLATESLLNLEEIRYEKAIRAEQSLRSFVRQGWHVVEPSSDYIKNWHIDAICEHLQAVSDGHIRNLLINMPPRCMKSLCVSVFWPMWEWTTQPWVRWMYSSYALSLAIRDNVKCRRLIESEWYQRNWGDVFQFSKDQNLKSRFENSKSGYRLAVSVGSAATGEGGDRIVCDDPHNVIEAESEAIRKSTLEWWDQTMSSRLNNPSKSAKIIVMQRVHQEDLSGHVLEQGNYVHLCLPAEYEPTRKCFTSIGWSDPREVEGELLWPDRLTRASLDSLKKVLGTIGFASQYQQSPVPLSGGQFKQAWFRYFTEEREYYALDTGTSIRHVFKETCTTIFTIDLAISTKTTADWTVISIWALTPEKELILIDRVRERFDNPQQQKQIQVLYFRYNPAYILIENVAYQLALIQQLLQQGIPARAYKPVKDKVSRASTAAVFYEAGRVYHPKGRSWLVEWEDELLMFPMGTHDDQVDTVSMACDVIGSPVASADEQIEAMKRRVELQGRRLYIVNDIQPTEPAFGVVSEEEAYQRTESAS
jgi:predicted phage terminase large subunit-like protein